MIPPHLTTAPALAPLKFPSIEASTKTATEVPTARRNQWHRKNHHANSDTDTICTSMDAELLSKGSQSLWFHTKLKEIQFDSHCHGFFSRSSPSFQKHPKNIHPPTHRHTKSHTPTNANHTSCNNTNMTGPKTRILELSFNNTTSKSELKIWTFQITTLV